METALVILLLYILVVVIGMTWFVKRALRRRRDRLEAHRRPHYECGNSVADWEQASQKSLDWSRERRNKGGK